MNTSSATEEQIKKLIEEMGELKEQVRAQKEEIYRLSKIIGNGKIETPINYMYSSSEDPVMLPETLTRYIENIIIQINGINNDVDELVRH
jgi:hypothetical protein